MAKKTETANLVGAWAFLIGVILAIIFGFFTPAVWLAWVLVILGIIIGLLNITTEETQPFLLAGTVFVIVSYLGGYVFGAEALGVAFLKQILDNLVALFVPATIIVALKSLFSLARK